jgi:hypothetical protein
MYLVYIKTRFARTNVLIQPRAKYESKENVFAEG